MRDIGSRIRRYRLSRYATPQGPIRRNLPWLLLALVAWGLWAGLFSSHGFYRLWRLERENARLQLDLEQVQREIGGLERQTRDPQALRDLAERRLRESNGMARRGEIIYRIQDAPRDSLRP